jgi:hypothetical protein
LFTDIGVDLFRFDTAFDRGFYGRHGLRRHHLFQCHPAL